MIDMDNATGTRRATWFELEQGIPIAGGGRMWVEFGGRGTVGPSRFETAEAAEVGAARAAGRDTSGSTFRVVRITRTTEVV